MSSGGWCLNAKFVRRADDTSAYAHLCVCVCVCVCARACVSLRRCARQSACQDILLSHLPHFIYAMSSGNSCCDIVTLSKFYWLAGPFRGAQVANGMWQPNELPVLNMNEGGSEIIAANAGGWTTKTRQGFPHTCTRFNVQRGLRDKALLPWETSQIEFAR